MSRDVGSGWMCERIEGKYMCIRFDRYKEVGFRVDEMIYYKEAFKNSHKGLGKKWEDTDGK